MSLPVRLVLITDTLMPYDWEDQIKVLRPVIKGIYKRLSEDLEIRPVVNTTHDLVFGTRYVHYYLENNAGDEHPVYIAYIPTDRLIELRLRDLRKEFFLRGSPNYKPRRPVSMEDELSNFVFATAKNIGGQIVNIEHNPLCIYYKVVGEKLTFRDFFFRQVRLCFRTVK